MRFSWLGKISENSAEVSQDHFGVNYQAYRNGSRDEFKEILEEVNENQIKVVRYPGGAIAEQYLDISDPRHFNPEIDKIREINPLGDNSKELQTTLSFLKDAANNGYSVVIVLPTKRYMSDDGKVNNNMEMEVFEYTSSAIKAASALGVEIKGFEVGNEWYVQREDGLPEMDFSLTAYQYGILSAGIANAAHKAIEEFTPIDSSEPFIGLQVGANWNNQDATLESIYDIHKGFEEAGGNPNAIKALIAHWYLRLGDTPNKFDYYKDGGVSNSSSDKSLLDEGIFSQFDEMENLLGHESGSLKKLVTEWNVGGPEYFHEFDGELQLDPILSMFHSMISGGVDLANFWAVINEKYHSLMRENGGTLTPTAHLMDSLQDNLIGLKAVDLNGASAGGAITLSDQLEASGDVRVYAFRGDEREVVIFSSRCGEPTSVTFDRSKYPIGDMSITKISIDPDTFDLPGHEQVSSTTHQAIAIQDGVLPELEIPLMPYEVVILKIEVWESAAIGTSADDFIRDVSAYDHVYAAEGSDTIFSYGGNDTLHGGAGNDSIESGPGNDSVIGGGGNDTINGSFGDDFINGGWGMDEIKGEAGRDILFGHRGDDSVFGGHGFDALYGGSGRDYLDGGNNGDLVEGGSGDDIIWGGDGLDKIYAGSGNDIVHAGRHADGVWGGTGDDFLFPEGGNDYVFGGSGNDYISGGSGRDWIFGGAGFDTIKDDSGDDVIFGGFNADKFVFSDSHNMKGHDTIRDFEVFNPFERIDLSGVVEIFDARDLFENHMSQVGLDVVIKISDDRSITIENCNLENHLSGDRFMF